MVNKKNRLSRSDFSRFFLLGKRIHTPYIQIIYTPSPSFSVAVVVSKKVSKKAVVRNKIKRRVYEILRLYYKSYKKNGVYIIIIKPTIQNISFKDLKEHIQIFIGRVEESG